jgi:predicted RNase H-like nuclease
MPTLSFKPWHVVENENDIDSAVLMWNKLFCDIADAHAPVKRRRVKGTQVPWMNSKISEAMQDRDYHHRKAVKSNKTYHWNMYKKLRNFVNKAVKSAKSKYYCELIEQSKGDSSRIWKVVNEVLSRDT